MSEGVTEEQFRKFMETVRGELEESKKTVHETKICQNCGNAVPVTATVKVNDEGEVEELRIY